MNNQYEINEPIIHPVDEQDVPKNLSILPRIYRLTGISFNPTGPNEIQCVATIFHEHAAMRVTWISNKPDLKLIQGNLVSPRWFGRAHCEKGAILISRLVAMESPEHGVNLFHTVPHEWVKNRAMIASAAKLVKLLPATTRFMFNCNYWSGEKFIELCNSTELAHRIDAS